MWVGFIMNWICIGVTLLNMNTLAYCIFGLSTYPKWAGHATNDCFDHNADVNTTTPIVFWNNVAWKREEDWYEMIMDVLYLVVHIVTEIWC